MPRELRQEIEGGIYHVYARGNKKSDIYRDAVDCRTYLTLLERVVLRQRWRCLAYCLMPNHLHLLIELTATNLALGMQRLQSDYARVFNARHGESGHVFQGRYGAVRITDDPQLWTTVGYIAANPVAAGLAHTPEAWRWSSHRATVGRAPAGWLDVDRLFAYLEGAGGDPRERYRELVADRTGDAAAGENT
jgi:REP element-mobilizing transposase RayT